MYKYLVFFLFVAASQVDLLNQRNNKTLKNTQTLKLFPKCCDIPELGGSKHPVNCYDPKLWQPCHVMICVFEAFGFLIDAKTMNKVAYRNHLKQWEKKHTGWSVAVDQAILDCIENDSRQNLKYPCKVLEVFLCTGIAMLKKCPSAALKC